MKESRVIYQYNIYVLLLSVQYRIKSIVCKRKGITTMLSILKLIKKKLETLLSILKLVLKSGNIAKYFKTKYKIRNSS